ncbi:MULTISPECIES: hypothetical protein [Nocardia]|uniref:Uncharacterized protein n=1 Tax=Nocardia vinacea TaxID=96468 RepID=A0ABZ1YLH4_9NOCA|nr:hypothetical protein [Nocardia vinacea]
MQSRTDAEELSETAIASAQWVSLCAHCGVSHPTLLEFDLQLGKPFSVIADSNSWAKALSCEDSRR